MRRPVVYALGLVTFLSVVATTQVAHAEKAVAKFMLHGAGMVTRHQDAPLKVAYGQSEPDMLSDVRLTDDGLLLGGGMLGSLMIDGTRLGLGVTFFGVQDTGMTLDALPAGYTLEGGRLWGESIELRLGREFQLGPLFPYIDLRLTTMVVAVNTTLRSEQYGVLGSTQYSRLSFGIGPAAGLFMPMDDTFFFDLSGYAGLFGDEKYGGIAGVGIWGDM